MPKLRWLQGRGVALALLFGYLVMALVVIQQQRTIASQGQLIHLLFRDTLELSAVRMQQHVHHR